MDIDTLIKSLKTIRKAHGNVSVQLMNPVFSQLVPVKSIDLTYPTNRVGLSDRTKPVNGVWIR